MSSALQSADTDDVNIKQSVTEVPMTSDKEFDSIDVCPDKNDQQPFDCQPEPLAHQLKRSAADDADDCGANHESKRQKFTTEIEPRKLQYESMQEALQYDSMEEGSTNFIPKRSRRTPCQSRLPLPISLEMINEMKDCIYRLEISIRQDIFYPNPYSNLNWNIKVLQFLKNNLKAAKHTNNYLARYSK